MDQITKFIKPGHQFTKDSIRLVKRCTKPDRRDVSSTAAVDNISGASDATEDVHAVEDETSTAGEEFSKFQKIAIATAIGFCIMGFIGFFVKLIHIPINNIIVGS